MTEGQESAREQRDQVYFMALVQNFQHLAWAGLGKVANPGQMDTKVDLEQAHWAIDMLEMIQRRTKGNLAPEEDRELAQVLHMLRMNYVEESKLAQERAKADAEEKTDADESAEAAADGGEPSAESADAAPETIEE